MQPKHLAVFATILVVVSGLSAVIAYRSGRQQWRSIISGRQANSPCIDFHDAGSHRGETACISGQILKVFASRGGNTFLDFCADYRNCPFTSVIFSSDRAKFGDLSVLAGRRLEIRGPISIYNGRAEIIIHEPQQIRETGN